MSRLRISSWHLAAHVLAVPRALAVACVVCALVPAPRSAEPAFVPANPAFAAVQPLVAAADPVPEIAVEVEPRPAEVGLVMKVTVIVSGAEGADCDMLALPVVDGGRLTSLGGPSRRNMSFTRNGRRTSSITTSWAFELIPERAGLLELPPFQLTCRGSTVESESVSLEVRESQVVDDVVTLEVTPSTTRLWVGQVVELAVKATVLEEAWDYIPQSNGFELDLPWLAGVPGLHPREIPTPNCTVALMAVNRGANQVPVCRSRDLSTGRTRQVFTGTIPMLATEPGTIALPTSRFSVRLVTETTERRDPLDVFSVFGGRRSVVPTRVVATDAVAGGVLIEVRPTPSEGRPDSFTNAVGRFRFEGEARPTRLKVGESCQLRLVLGSEGPSNLDQVVWPPFDGLDEDFRIFGKDEQQLLGQRVLELEISPKTEQVTEVPALEFACFNPATERYEVLTVGPFELSVESGGEGGLAYLATPDEILNDVETIRESLPAPAKSGAPPWIWFGGAAALFALVELRRQAGRWRAAHPDKVARRGARRRLDQGLAAATGVADVARAFSQYLAARLGGPPAGLTVEEAGDLLGDEQLADQMKSVVAGWEASYLGGARLDLEQARNQARELAGRVEGSK